MLFMTGCGPTLAALLNLCTFTFMDYIIFAHNRPLWWYIDSAAVSDVTAPQSIGVLAVSCRRQQQALRIDKYIQQWVLKVKRACYVLLELYWQNNCKYLHLSKTRRLQTHQCSQTSNLTSRPQPRRRRPAYVAAAPVYAVHALHQRSTPGCQVPADNAACCTSEPEQCLLHTASVPETTAIDKTCSFTYFCMKDPRLPLLYVIFLG